VLTGTRAFQFNATALCPAVSIGPTRPKAEIVPTLQTAANRACVLRVARALMMRARFRAGRRRRLHGFHRSVASSAVPGRLAQSAFLAALHRLHLTGGGHPNAQLSSRPLEDRHYLVDISGGLQTLHGSNRFTASFSGIGIRLRDRNRQPSRWYFSPVFVM
jgi:hypothetical protein